MSADAPELTNYDHLASHLKAGTLAARLVVAFAAAKPESRDAALQQVILARIEEVARIYEPGQDKKD